MQPNFFTARTVLLSLALLGACGSDDTGNDAGSNDGGQSSTQGDNAPGDASPDGDDAGGTANGDNTGDASNGDSSNGDSSNGSSANGGGNDTVPTVVTTSPASGAASVAVNSSVTIVFSEAMDPETLNASTFTLSAGASEVLGKFIISDSTLVFWPDAYLTSKTAFTATLSNGAKSASGVAIAEEHVWTFDTADEIPASIAVDLGTAGDYVILAKSAISTVPKSAVTGNVAVSPAAATYITGFSLTADATNVFATSTQVTGKVYAANYKAPTAAKLTTAVSDMQGAFTDAARRAPTMTELGAGNIGGMTLAPGVYKWGTGLMIPTDVTLSGSATDVWIFQIAKGLTISAAAKTMLSGGALPKNVFWQVSGAVELGTTAHIDGIVLSMTAITLKTGASVHGRLLAQTAVSIDKSTVLQP